MYQERQLKLSQYGASRIGCRHCTFISTICFSLAILCSIWILTSNNKHYTLFTRDHSLYAMVGIRSYPPSTMFGIIPIIHTPMNTYCCNYNITYKLLYLGPYTRPALLFQRNELSPPLTDFITPWWLFIAIFRRKL